MVTPAEFAKNLYNSSLSDEDRGALLALLPKLDLEQISKINDILLKDANKEQSTLQQVKLKGKMLQAELKQELDNNFNQMV